MGKKLVTGGVMQLSNDTSKNSTSPPYLVKNERSLMILVCYHYKVIRRQVLLTVCNVQIFILLKAILSAKSS